MRACVIAGSSFLPGSSFKDRILLEVEPGYRDWGFKEALERVLRETQKLLGEMLQDSTEK